MINSGNIAKSLLDSSASVTNNTPWIATGSWRRCRNSVRASSPERYLLPVRLLSAGENPETITFASQNRDLHSRLISKEKLIRELGDQLETSKENGARQASLVQVCRETEFLCEIMQSDCLKYRCTCIKSDYTERWTSSPSINPADSRCFLCQSFVQFFLMGSESQKCCDTVWSWNWGNTYWIRSWSLLKRNDLQLLWNQTKCSQILVKCAVLVTEVFHICGPLQTRFLSPSTITITATRLYNLKNKLILLVILITKNVINI